MSHLRRASATGALLALSASLGLAGCGGIGGAKGLGGILEALAKPCPPPVVVSEARYLYELEPGRAEADAVRVAGRITTPVAQCKYWEGKIFVELNLPFEAARGPALAKGGLEFEFPYFVAVADRFDNILAKEVFVARVELGGGQERSSGVEKIEQIIPLGPRQDGTHFVIYVGFQLTPEQIEFNRRHRL